MSILRLHLESRKTSRRREEALTRRSSGGFTLIEISIAILILAGSLAVILGLQASSVRRAAHDKLEMRAILASRRIMAEIETASDPIEVGIVKGTALDVLRSVSALQKGVRDEDGSLQGLNAELDVAYRDLPGVGEKVMKEIKLKVSWGQADSDAYSLTYFIANDDQKYGNDGQI